MVKINAKDGLEVPNQDIEAENVSADTSVFINGKALTNDSGDLKWGGDDIGGIQKSSTTISYTDMNSTSSVLVFALPAKGVVTDMHLSVDTAFDSGTKAQMGIEDGNSKFITSQDIDSTGLKGEPYDVDKEMLSSSSSTDVKLYSGNNSWSSGGNLNTARHYLAGCGTQTAGLSFGGDTGSVVMLQKNIMVVLGILKGISIRQEEH